MGKSPGHAPDDGQMTLLTVRHSHYKTSASGAERQS